MVMAIAVVFIFGSWRDEEEADWFEGWGEGEPFACCFAWWGGGGRAFV